MKKEPIDFLEPTDFLEQDYYKYHFDYYNYYKRLIYNMPVQAIFEIKDYDVVLKKVVLCA